MASGKKPLAKYLPLTFEGLRPGETDVGGPESDPRSDPESDPEMVPQTDAKWCQNDSSKQSKPFGNLMFCKGAAPAGGPVKDPEMVSILVPKTIRKPIPFCQMEQKNPPYFWELKTSKIEYKGFFFASQLVVLNFFRLGRRN